MILFLNFSALLIFAIVSFYIFRPAFDKYRLVKFVENSEYLYRINRNMYFLIFVVCTAPFFLGQFSLFKYGIYFVTLIVLLLLGKIRIKVDIIVGFYLIFFLWLVISMIYTESLYDSIMLLIKYTIPLFSLWLGYSAIESKYDLYYFSKAVTQSSVIYALIIGGFSATFMPWLYTSSSTIFLKYAGLADYFTSIFVLFLVMHWVTSRKTYLLGALWVLLSTILAVVRTGLGGIALACAFFAFFRHRFRSIPYIIAAGLLFIGIILFVPSVNEKFFGEESGTVTAHDIVQGDALSLDNIQTSGREALWTIAMNKFYEPSPIVGSGLGTTTHFIKERAAKEHTIALLHSDYVQILCDNGIIGIVLISIFYLCIIMKVFRYTWKQNVNEWIKISGIMAVASMAGVAFSMGFDNVVSHSMTSLINPFIFIGFFLKFIDIDKYESIS